jgi:hypothetical protein
MAVLSASLKNLSYVKMEKRPSEKLPTSSLGRASGDGGDYGDLIAISYLGVLPFEVSDVLVALVDVDERAQLAVTRIQVLS